MGEQLKTATLSFAVDTPQGQTASQEVYSPITGIIKKITLSFPRNANFALGAKFTLKTVTIIPTPARGGTEYIHLDNHTETIYPEQPISQGDILSLRTINSIIGETVMRTVSAVVHIEQQ